MLKILRSDLLGVVGTYGLIPGICKLTQLQATQVTFLAANWTTSKVKILDFLKEYDYSLYSCIRQDNDYKSFGVALSCQAVIHMDVGVAANSDLIPTLQSMVVYS